MRAIIYRLDENCKPIAMVGNDPTNRRLTKEYKTFATLYRYTIRPALVQWNGKLRAEIYFGNSIYGVPDRVHTWNTGIFK